MRDNWSRLPLSRINLHKISLSIRVGLELLTLSSGSRDLLTKLTKTVLQPELTIINKQTWFCPIAQYLKKYNRGSYTQSLCNYITSSIVLMWINSPMPEASSTRWAGRGSCWQACSCLATQTTAIVEADVITNI